ncbi:MAG: agmatinase family protein [Woeseiaceae bacterium]|nr:agmatinase family protein [Woeseiaceae bacterium]
MTFANRYKVLPLFMIAALLVTVSRTSAQDEEFEAVDLPDSLAEKVAGLDPEKIDFIRGPRIFQFAGSHERLFDRFKNKSAAEIEGYIDAMIRVQELNAFNPETDMAAIPLNTEDRGFNSWKTLRPKEFDTPRDDGPINVNRYLRAGPKNGIPTFFNMPIAMTPEDLVAGDVDVAIMGVGLDTGTGYRGAAYGPRALRTGTIYGGTGMSNLPHMHTMVSAFNELTVVDYGDVNVDLLSLERSLEHIRTMVREVAAAGSIPMIVGGDHSLMYPDVAGVVDVYGVGNVGVIHFDAHYDAGESGSHLLSHGQPVRRLFNEKLVPGKNFIQVGLRGSWPGRAGFEWMQQEGLRYHPMAEIEKNGWDAVKERVFREALEDGPEHIFISFDIDVLDPAYMPGTGTPEPGGLTTREAFPIVRGLCASKHIVGFELVELNPLVDPGYTTAQNSNRILYECLTGIAMRKLGISDPNYLSPLTTEHGHDE